MTPCLYLKTIGFLEVRSETLNLSKNVYVCVGWVCLTLNMSHSLSEKGENFDILKCLVKSTNIYT